MTPPDDAAAAPPARGGSRLHAEQDDAASEADADRSLLEDVEALIEDGRTYLEAELAFQKTRALFAADQVKSAAVLAAIAVLLAFLALIGLTVGLIIALSPVLTPWGAGALVVLVLAGAALFAARAAARQWNRLIAEIDTGRGGES